MDSRLRGNDRVKDEIPHQVRNDYDLPFDCALSVFAQGYDATSVRAQGERVCHCAFLHPPAQILYPPAQILYPKEYTYKENTAKEDTERKQLAKKREKSQPNTNPPFF